MDLRLPGSGQIPDAAASREIAFRLSAVFANDNETGREFFPFWRENWSMRCETHARLTLQPAQISIRWARSARPARFDHRTPIAPIDATEPPFASDGFVNGLAAGGFRWHRFTPDKEFDDSPGRNAGGE